jgi:hypothetical protein
MILESPLIREILAERFRETLLRALRTKFGEVPPELSAQVHAIADVQRLETLIVQAVVCPDLAAFREKMTS